MVDDKLNIFFTRLIFFSQQTKCLLSVLAGLPYVLILDAYFVIPHEVLRYHVMLNQYVK